MDLFRRLFPSFWSYRSRVASSTSAGFLPILGFAFTLAVFLFFAMTFNSRPTLQVYCIFHGFLFDFYLFQYFHHPSKRFSSMTMYVFLFR